MYAIGVDVGGTTVKLGCVQDGINIIYRDKRQSPRDPLQMAPSLVEVDEVALRQGRPFAHDSHGEPRLETPSVSKRVRTDHRERVGERLLGAICVKRVCVVSDSHTPILEG